MMTGNDVWARIRALKLQGNDFFSNASLIATDIDVMCMDEGTQVHLGDGFLALMRFENGFSRLYLYADQMERFHEVTEQLKTSLPLTVYERVSLRQKADQDTSILSSCGWKHHRELSYWTCRTDDVIHDLDNLCSGIEVAVESDVHNLMSMLYAAFDVKVSHLPDERYLLNRVHCGEVTVIRKSNEIAAFVIVEKTGIKARYVYQVLTVPEWRGNGFADILLRGSMANSPLGTLFSLWVESNNLAAISLYTKLGYQQTNRVLNIWVLKGDCQNGNNYEDHCRTASGV